MYSNIISKYFYLFLVLGNSNTSQTYHAFIYWHRWNQMSIVFGSDFSSLFLKNTTLPTIIPITTTTATHTTMMTVVALIDESVGASGLFRMLACTSTGVVSNGSIDGNGMFGSPESSDWSWLSVSAGVVVGVEVDMVVVGVVVDVVVGEAVVVDVVVDVVMHLSRAGQRRDF